MKKMKPVKKNNSNKNPELRRKQVLRILVISFSIVIILSMVLTSIASF